MTASTLLAALQTRGVTLEDSPAGLAIYGDPGQLDAPLGVLATGIRALLSNRRWIGYPSATGLPVVLNPQAQLPAGIDRLCVEGDKLWDCLPTSLLAAHAEFWAPAPQKRKAA